MEAQYLAGPKIKAQRDGRLIVFVDESGISERPTRVRTWAPKGHTPVIQFHFNWNHVSVIAGITRTNCMFRLHEGSSKKEEVVDFLKALKAHLKQPLLVIWDGLKAHRSRLVRDYLDSLTFFVMGSKCLSEGAQSATRNLRSILDGGLVQGAGYDGSGQCQLSATSAIAVAIPWTASSVMRGGAKTPEAKSSSNADRSSFSAADVRSWMVSKVVSSA